MKMPCLILTPNPGDGPEQVHILMDMLNPCPSVHTQVHLDLQLSGCSPVFNVPSFVKAKLYPTRSRAFSIGTLELWNFLFRIISLALFLLTFCKSMKIYFFHMISCG